MRVADEFILKITDRCNIACTYCYMYEFDTNYHKQKPARMSRQVFEESIRKIAIHSRANNLRRVIIHLHGGEPLMFGKKNMIELLSLIQCELDEVRHRVMLQTNALLIDREWLDIFERFRVVVSASLDGPETPSNTYRIDKRGNGTARRAERGVLELIRSYPPDLFGGVLCVINPAVSGAETYRYFTGLGLRRFDFLLPDGNFASKPKQFVTPSSSIDLQRFLISAFDQWFEDDDPEIQVRLFREIISSLAFKKSKLDLFGNVDGASCVVETDGELIANDVLRICGRQDWPRLNVLSNSFDDMRDGVYFPWSSLSRTCEECSILGICGGGYPAHRYDGGGFANPSFFCGEIRALVDHVTRRIRPLLLPRELALLSSGRQGALAPGDEAGRR